MKILRKLRQMRDKLSLTASKSPTRPLTPKTEAEQAVDTSPHTTGDGTANAPAQHAQATSTMPLPTGYVVECSDSTPGVPSVARQQADALIDRAVVEHETATRLGSKTGKVVHSAPVWEAARTTAELWDSLINALKTFSRGVDTIGDIHPYAKVATVTLTAIVKPIVNQAARDEAFEGLLNEMIRTFKHVKEDLLLDGSAASKPVDFETKLLLEISRVSEECARFIQDEYVTRGFWTRTAKNSLRGGTVDDMIQRFKDAFANLREDWRDAKLKYLDATATLARLDPVRNAGHTRDKACLPNTRIDVLCKLSDWIRDPGGERALFVLGVAGSGKSSIAHSMAVQAQDEGILGAFFAFDRSDVDRSPRRVLSTLAHSLALRHENYCSAILGQLRAFPELASSTDVSEQWERFFHELSTALSSSGPLLLLVDAFDECPSSPEDRSRQRLLDCLTSGVTELPTNVRVLVTSRAEVDVVSATRASVRLDLADVPASTDISLYVRHRLPPEDLGGLTDLECEELAHAADGLFQWAATACGFLESRRAGTNMRRKFTTYQERLLRGDVELPGGRPSLNALYRMVLETAFDPDDELALMNYRDTLSIVLCAREPLSVSHLDSIYSLAVAKPLEGTLPAVLAALGVVLHGVTNPFSSVRAMHTSFSDFLLDDSRSWRWHIRPQDLQKAHYILALGSLRVMYRDLKFNMCSITTSCYVSMPIDYRHPGLEALPPGLLYGALNWSHHISGVFGTNHRISTAWYDSLDQALRLVLYEKFLFWLELHVLCETLAQVEPSLHVAARTIATHPDTVRLVNEARLFVRSFKVHLLRSVPNIYLSALPFTPASSLLGQRLLSHFPGIPKVSPELHSWPASCCELDDISMQDVGHMVFVSDSVIAMVLNNYQVELYSYPALECLISGRALPLEEWISCIAFSASNRLIASGHRTGSIRFWDYPTLHECGSHEHDGQGWEVRSLCFTPDGVYLFSCHENGFVLQWDIAAGRRVRSVKPNYPPLTDCDIPSISLACSPDSRHVYFGYNAHRHELFMGDVRQTRSPCLRIPPPTGPSALACSQKRNYIAIGVADLENGVCIRIYNTETHTVVVELSGHTAPVKCLAWSLDGRLLVSADIRDRVLLWDAEKMLLAGGYNVPGSGSYKTVTFSPDGSIVLGISWRGMHGARVKDILATTVPPTPSLVAYSADGRYLRADFSGIPPSTLFWDAQTGASLAPPDECQWSYPHFETSHDGRFRIKIFPTSIAVCELQDGDFVTTKEWVSYDEGDYFCFDISRDNRRALIFSPLDGLWLLDLTSCEKTYLCICNMSYGVPPAVFSPDGQEIAVATGGGVAVWSVESSSGTYATDSGPDARYISWSVEATLSDEHPRFPYANFTPQPTTDPETGEELADAEMRCTKPSIDFPKPYWDRVWAPGMRLLLGEEPLSVDFSSGCYGTEWARCYAG